MGKTKPLTNTGATIKKHPHVRGEDGYRIQAVVQNKETPPRAWGRPAPEQADKLVFRNTPTCVGKTNGLYIPAYREKKHPHVRGEDSQELS